MAYQSAKMAEKLNNAMAGRNDVATNNADPIRQMQGQVGRPQQVVAGQEPAAGRYANYTAPPADDGINFARIGRGLSGLGAGIQGRGAEFSKGLREDRAQQQKLREEALITDTMYSKRALDSGNMPAFLKRMESRIDAGIKMGMDMTDSVRLYNLAETDPEAAKAQVNAGYQNLVDRGLVEAPEAYNLQTKKVRDPVTGKLEMRVFDPRKGQFVGESLGEPASDGTTVNIDNAVKPWSQIVSRYDKQMKTVNDTYKRIQRVQSALKTTGGASPKALQAAISDIFGGNTRAIENLKQWASFGNLPDNLINKAKKFAMGNYTDLAKDDISRLLASYQEYNGEEHQAINDRFTKVANANKVDLDTIISEVKPFPKSYDFLSMTPDELSKVPLDTLLGYQRTDFNNALNRIEGQ